MLRDCAGDFVCRGPERVSAGERRSSSSSVLFRMFGKTGRIHSSSFYDVVCICNDYSLVLYGEAGGRIYGGRRKMGICVLFDRLSFSLFLGVHCPSGDGVGIGRYCQWSDGDSKSCCHPASG